jgi:ParB family chromosome partitioning protein
MAFGDNPLGRSLSDVFAKTVRREPARGYLEVDLGLIRPPSANPRTDFDEAALNELAASIRQHGMLQPIVVLRREEGYEVLSGERRYRAAKIAGLEKVPVVVRDDTDPAHVAELRLIENIQRENLNPLELARAYQSLIDTHQLSHEEIAERVNKERSSISNTLRLLALAPAVQQLVTAGAITLGHAKALLAITEPAQQAAVAHRIASESLSVRAAEDLARTHKEGAAGGARPKSSAARELETNLRLLFGARVSIAERGGGRGSLTVHFDSQDQLNRVVVILDRVLKQSGKT